MNTVRFAKLVAECGRPENHLVLTDPAKDKLLQAAIKASRVLTIHQEQGGTNYGTFGFSAGRERQFLVFPKSLARFKDARIVGIKYDLLASEPDTEITPTTKAREEQRESKRKPEAATPAAKPPASAGASAAAIEKVLDFPKAPPKQASGKKSKTLDAQQDPIEPKSAPEKELARDETKVRALKEKVREAMDVLEQGRQIQAFSLLKQIVDS
jgi:hypothetical protein